MWKISAPVLPFVIAAIWSSACAHHSQVQDREIAKLADEMIDQMKSLPEPYQSWAIEKIKDAKRKDWNSIGDFYMELLMISQQVLGKSESELNISKREIHEESSEFRVDFMLEYAVHMLESTVNESQRPILKEKLDEAVKMKWKSADDFVNYCYKIYEDVTGVDLTKY